MSDNPFRPTRYEYHNKPLLWLSPVARKLEDPTSHYVTGTRGSGKTSLLKTLHWKERQYNETLRDQINGSNDKFLSVYFRVPDHISFALSKIQWDRIDGINDPDAAAFAYFSALIEAIAAQLIFECIQEKQISRTLPADAGRVSQEISKLLHRYPELKKFCSVEPVTFGDLASAFDVMQRKLNVAAVRGAVSAVLKAIPEYEPGGLLLDVARLVADEVVSAGQVEAFHIKVCVDDCEVLRKEQQRYLNSLVRKAQMPLSWIISYVGRQYDATNGLYPEHNLTDADRKVVDLDESDESSFTRLCEAVSSLRIYYSLPEKARSRIDKKEAHRIFSLDKVAGELGINQLIQHLGATAISQGFDELTASAKQFNNALGELEKKSGLSRIATRLGGGRRVLPYYQAFLMRRLLAQTDFSQLATRTPKDLQRLAAYLRRKQRGALIAICASLRIRNIPYAGKYAVIGLSDSCIRDYLEILAEFYDGYSTEFEKLSQFYDRKEILPIPLQRGAIMRAADSKFAGILETTELYRKEISALVECLGTLTALCQRDIRTAERGMFYLDLDELQGHGSYTADAIFEAVVRILSRGHADGVIRTDDIAEKLSDTDAAPEIRFRLHRRFAPRFGYSFRGPYEPLKLPWDKMAEICLGPDKVEPRKWAEQVLSRLGEFDPMQVELDL